MTLQTTLYVEEVFLKKLNYPTKIDIGENQTGDLKEKYSVPIQYQQTNPRGSHVEELNDIGYANRLLLLSRKHNRTMVAIQEKC